MRKDQPELKKQFTQLNREIKLLTKESEELEKIINIMGERILDLEEANLIAGIEFDRLLEGKPALTKEYSVIRKIAEEINLM